MPDAVAADRARLPAVLETGEAVVNREMSGRAPAAPGETPALARQLLPGARRRRDHRRRTSWWSTSPSAGRPRSSAQSSWTTWPRASTRWTPRGGSTFMNAAASQMLGWTEEELRGKPMHAVIHYQRADGSPFPEEECALLRVRTRGPPDPGHRRRLHPQGRDASSRSPTPPRRCAAVERLHGVVVVFRDITEEKAEQHANPARAGRARPGSDVSATRSTRTGSSSTPSRSSRSGAAQPARSCCCG